MSDFLSDVGTTLPRLIEQGLAPTLYSFLGGAVLMLIVATILGVSMHQGPTWLSVIARIIVEVFRGTSLVVQLFFLFYVVPTLTGFDLGGMWSAIVGLGLNYGAYGAEVVRGSLNAVPKGQWETTTALSMPWLTKFRRVIWPQAWALMLPGFNNLAVMLVKGTAAVSLVLLNDVTFEAGQARRDVGTWVSFGCAMVIYLVVALIVSTVFRWMEKRAQQRLGFKVSKQAADKAVAEAVA